MPNNKKRPPFNHRAVAIGAATPPFSFWLFHGSSATCVFVVYHNPRAPDARKPPSTGMAMPVT